MTTTAAGSEHFRSIAEIASAEKAAKEGDGSKALQYLSKAGMWTWDVATKIGVGVAIVAAKKALGIP